MVKLKKIMDNLKLSVVIPAYNEGKRIARTLGSVADYLAKQPYESEVLVVANNCTDNTVEVAQSYSNRIKNLRIIDVPEGECTGKGCAVKIGIFGAKGDYVLFMDADNATKLHEVDEFWPYFDKGYQVVIGSRYIKGSKFVKKQTMMRRFISRAGNILIQAVLLPGIKDSQCGFKVFTRADQESCSDILKWDRNHSSRILRFHLLCSFTLSETII